MSPRTTKAVPSFRLPSTFRVQCANRTRLAERRNGHGGMAFVVPGLLRNDEMTR